MSVNILFNLAMLFVIICIISSCLSEQFFLRNHIVRYHKASVVTAFIAACSVVLFVILMLVSIFLIIKNR